MSTDTMVLLITHESKRTLGKSFASLNFAICDTEYLCLKQHEKNIFIDIKDKVNSSLKISFINKMKISNFSTLKN